MLKNKVLWTTVGFVLIITGFLALALSMVGLGLAPLAWLDQTNSLLGFIIKLLMIIGGFVLVYLSQTDLSQLDEEEELEPK